MRSYRRSSGLVIAALLLILSACTVRLAPDYDPVILSGLADANQQTLTLFAALSRGTQPAAFPQREAEYNAVIGKFDALRLEAAARPNPNTANAGLFARAAGVAETPDLEERLKAPTPRILATIIAKLTQLRDDDRARPLTPSFVALFKHSYEISFQQAFTYERALQR